MSANINDYFNKASNMNGSYPAVATVSSARSTGGSTLSCDDLSSWATDTPVHFSTFKVAADGTIDTSTQTDWKGIVVGNTITEMTRLAGAADSGNASGDKVELNPTIGWLDDLISGILISHKQNGGLKDSVVTESTIATGAVSTNKIADSAVTSAKIDFTTLSGNYSTSEVDTGYTWIDGKTIYKKTYQFAVTSRSMQVAHGISSLGTIIKAEGVWEMGNGGFQPINRNAADQTTQQYNTGLGDIGPTYFLFQLGSGMTVGGQGLVTFYYTKAS